MNDAPDYDSPWKEILDAFFEDKLTVLKLFKFLDWLVWLPKELQNHYKEELIRYEEEKRMPYITTIERMGIE